VVMQYSEMTYSVRAAGQDLVFTNNLKPTYQITVRNSV